MADASTLVESGFPKHGPRGRGKFALALTFAFLATGCAAAQPTQATGPMQSDKPSERPAWKRGCDEYVKGPVTIEYQDATGGSAVIYRSPGGEAGLRQRAEEVARYHNGSAAKSGTLHDLSSIPHRAYVEPIDGGVKLLLMAKTPRTSDLEQLRWRVQQSVSIMQKSGCQNGQEGL